MSVSEFILTGSLLLGQDVSWNGEHVVKDLCLYSTECTESSLLYSVSFLLEAVINLTAIKLFTLRRERWTVGQIDANADTSNFLAEVFNEEFNLCGTTTKALLIQVKSNDISIDNLTILVYGEKEMSSINIYAQPLIDDMEYHSIYEMAANNTTSRDKEREQMVLDEIFGIKYKYQHQTQDMTASSDLTSPPVMLSELDMIRNYNSIDLIAPTTNLPSNSQKTITKSRVNKSIPTKYPASSSSKKQTLHPRHQNIPPSKQTHEERKNLLKRAIKHELGKQGKFTIELFQQVYASVKYSYRDIIQSTVEINRESLQIIVKMHVDFYLNMDSVIALTISK